MHSRCQASAESGGEQWKGRVERTATSTLAGVAAPKRRAELDSPEAIEEDLHFARDASGIARATEEQLRATVARVLAADLTNAESAVLVARDLLIAHVVRTCRTLVRDKADDACAVAAANSTRDALVRPPEVSRKLRALRQQALQVSGCHLSVDGLRKREDLIVRDIAKAAWADLEARQKGVGPQTAEQVILLMRPTVRVTRDILFEVLLRLYPQETARFTDATGYLFADALFRIAELQWLARTLLAVLKQSPAGTMPSEVFFASLAQAFLFLPLSSDADKAAIAEVFNQHWRSSEEFMRAVMERDDAEDVTGNWVDWLVSCHDTCAYHRTRNVGLMCQPHQLAALLEAFIEFADDLVSGDLTKEMVEDFGVLTVPEFVKHYDRGE